MAGFYKLLLIGPFGGYMGSDGISNIEQIIAVGTADREWYESIYPKRGIKYRPEQPICDEEIVNALNHICPELVRKINHGKLLNIKDLSLFPLYICNIDEYKP